MKILNKFTKLLELTNAFNLHEELALTNQAITPISYSLHLSSALPSHLSFLAALVSEPPFHLGL